MVADGFTHERGYKGETNIWLTPPDLIQKLGPFDLDPCAAPEPRPWSTAATHYTEAEGDGLKRPWFGFIWCNPPYGPEMGNWMGRMAEVNNGIGLIFARTETKAFFDHIWPKATGICFLKGRLCFYRPDGSKGQAAGAPSCLVAFGEEADRRIRAASIPGICLRLK